VAADLREVEDWLREVASEMEIEDGVIWVYGVGEDDIEEVRRMNEQRPESTN
jgi:hypothetical protein